MNAFKNIIGNLNYLYNNIYQIIKQFRIFNIKIKIQIEMDIKMEMEMEIIKINNNKIIIIIIQRYILNKIIIIIIDIVHGQSVVHNMAIHLINNIIIHNINEYLIKQESLSNKQSICLLIKEKE